MYTSLASSLPSPLDGGGKLSSTSLQYWGQVPRRHCWRQSPSTSGGKARSQIPPFRKYTEKQVLRIYILYWIWSCAWWEVTIDRSDLHTVYCVDKCIVYSSQILCRNHCKLCCDRRWGKQWVHSRSKATPNQRDRRRNKHGPAANRMRGRLITRHFTCTTDPVAVHAQCPTSFHLPMQAGSA